MRHHAVVSALSFLAEQEINVAPGKPALADRPVLRLGGLWASRVRGDQTIEGRLESGAVLDPGRGGQEAALAERRVKAPRVVQRGRDLPAQSFIQGQRGAFRLVLGLAHVAARSRRSAHRSGNTILFQSIYDFGVGVIALARRVLATFRATAGPAPSPADRPGRPGRAGHRRGWAPGRRGATAGLAARQSGFAMESSNSTSVRLMTSIRLQAGHDGRRTQPDSRSPSAVSL